ncbi:hypothetical protein D3C78_811350 [compost metagenome]
MLNAVTNHGVALDLGMCTHTDQFRHVHKAIFEDGLGDHTGAFRDQVQQAELSLHIGWEPRVRRGANGHRFRTLAVHVQTDPVFTHFNIRTGFTQLGQHRIQRIRTGITAHHFTTGNRGSDQEGAGFDTVRQNAINAAAQALNALDGDAVTAGTGDFRTQRVKEVGSIDNFRLTCGVLNHGGAGRQGGGAHDGHGSANAHLVHNDVCALQAAIDGSFNIAFFQFDLCTELFQTGNMQIDRTRTDGAAARQRNLTTAETGNQRPQRPDRSAHGFHQIVGCTEFVHAAGVNEYGTVAFNLGA